MHRILEQSIWATKICSTAAEGYFQSGFDVHLLWPTDRLVMSESNFPTFFENKSNYTVTFFRRAVALWNRRRKHKVWLFTLQASQRSLSAFPAWQAWHSKLVSEILWRRITQLPRDAWILSPSITYKYGISHFLECAGDWPISSKSFLVGLLQRAVNRMRFIKWKHKLEDGEELIMIFANVLLL